MFDQHKAAGVLPTGRTYHVSPTTAELVKYSKNFFYALKVIYSNQMYDICKAMGVEWDEVKDIITSEQRQQIGGSHMNPIFGLYRGFGGKCLPKDTMALGVLAESRGVKYRFMDSIQRTLKTSETSRRGCRRMYCPRTIEIRAYSTVRKTK